MNLRDALTAGRKVLAGSGADDADLEAEVLLRYRLGISRTFLFTNPGKEIAPDEYAAYLALLERRQAGEPVAYITGTREFYGLEFTVNPSVLIPRPETELLVETAVGIFRKKKYRTGVDVGTGSGCIAASLAYHVPDAVLYAVDISPEALATARVNSRNHRVEERITFLQGDLLEPLPERVDLIAANLPYIDDAGMPVVNTRGYEPDLALRGGSDGLSLIRRLIGQAGGKLTRGGSLLLEIGFGQADAVCLLLEAAFPGKKPVVMKGLAGIDRVVYVSVS
ncbi:MAG: peptide chain release factor N(5)-glutamine methyltransferase [Dehalococcoidales bacterium]|nr:peptide chain release factor N(5)-glutamine methyltransferase [Dehalococcoidales bacterium]